MNDLLNAIGLTLKFWNLYGHMPSVVLYKPIKSYHSFTESDRIWLLDLKDIIVLNDNNSVQAKELVNG